ncbi:MAG: CPBP family intramembrane metalloprotease [Ruminococcaceae bacterium]|nr:CPBP family intramembrane metalloprotease [Oscillospiraceae bacterium]
MKRLYEKSEIGFALLWVGLYVAVMNMAMQLCGGFDNLESKTVPQLLVPVICGLLLAAAATFWILRSDLGKKYGFCRLSGDKGAFLWFIPLVLMSCTNLKNGLTLPADLSISVLMAVNMAIAGYVEEVIFRGFLFRAMAKDGLKSAVIVSAVTFGAGHIVNLGNTADTYGVLLQICYAIAIGFLFTVIVYKGGSLWPCILSHMFVNASSVFAREEGLFADLIRGLFGQATPLLTEVCSALLIILISGGYALWLWKKAPDPVI